jgi:oxygen-dependent protoporphyrinogen oxidase
MPQYRVGHRELIERVDRQIGALPGVELAGGYLRGIGIGDCLREGAAAAARALAHVERTAAPAGSNAPGDLPAADGVEDRP